MEAWEHRMHHIEQLPGDALGQLDCPISHACDGRWPDP
jgi:hypothetical protein